jgi:hypothetical protein
MIMMMMMMMMVMVMVMIEIAIQFFIIFVPTQQLQGQRIVDTGSCIKEKHNIKDKRQITGKRRSVQTKKKKMQRNA